MSKTNVIFNHCRPLISALTAFAVFGAQAMPLAGAVAAGTSRSAKATTTSSIAGAKTLPGQAAMTRADYEACQARDEAGFKAAVETITRRALRRALQNVDYDAAVADAWRRRNVQKIIDAQVDKAIKQVREESSWDELLKSLASKAKAKELATTVATRVYRSDEAKKVIEALAMDVGASVGKRIELATVDAAGPAQKCMQAFLGARFGETVARVVSTDASNRLEVDSDSAGAQVSSGSIILQSSGGIAGVMVLIVRRQLSKIAARVGQRVLGAVLARLVSVVAGGVGIVLIAKDIWDFRHGVLPIISAEMKSPATSAKVQQELAKELKQQIALNIDDIGSKSADRVVQIWRDFRQAHSKVLDLAERHSAFKSFLNTVPARKLAQLDEVVAITLAGEGESGVLKRLADGTLDEAVKRLPGAAMQIARDTRSLSRAYAWNRLAGKQLAQVLEYGIHRRAAPSDFSKSGLQRILALDDGLAVTRLVGLSREARTSLFELAQTDLTTLARALSQNQLDALSRYLTGLTREASKRLLYAVAANPSKMRALESARVRAAMMASDDQLAAVNMMVRSSNVFDLTTFMEDVSLLRAMKISPWLVWERYPTSLSVLAVMSLLILLLFWRMLFGRRPKVIVQMPPGHVISAGGDPDGREGAGSPSKTKGNQA